MFKRFFKQDVDTSAVEVTFVTKSGCHLCDDALAVIEAVRNDHAFQLKMVEIEPGDEWFNSYWDKVPVILLDGQAAFTYRVDPDEFLARLQTCARGEQADPG